MFDNKRGYLSDMIGGDMGNKSKINTGVIKAENAARQIRASIAIPTSKDGGKIDFNDLAMSQGVKAVRDTINDAINENLPPALPEGFLYDKDDGSLCIVERDNKTKEIKNLDKICGHIEVLAITHGAAKFGYFLSWIDITGREHRQAVPANLFVQQGSGIAEYLAKEGLLIMPGKISYFKEFILKSKPTKTIRNVDRVGWYGVQYVLPDTVIGNGENLIFQSDNDELYESLYKVSGKLSDWVEIARLAEGNDLLIFALCVAFASPLAELFGRDCGVFHLVGSSSKGKSIAQELAASVWGLPEKGKQIQQWRLTANGFESICPLYNSNLIVLDEFGESRGRDIDNIIYMFSGGTGKIRANRSGGARKPHLWRATLLSSGEIDLETKLNEDGINSRAGQTVRFINITVPDDHIKETHGKEGARELMEDIHTRLKQSYGTAGRYFLRAINANFAEIQKNVKTELEKFQKKLVPENSDSQVWRVAERFALIDIAGELAQKYLSLPDNLDVSVAVINIFDSWLRDRGSIRAAEDTAILKTVRLFLEQHGASRFQYLKGTEKSYFQYEDEQDRVYNRVGFRIKDHNEYWIPCASFEKEVIKGYSKRQAVDVLFRHGWLSCKNSTQKRIQGVNTRVYVITMPDDTEDDEQ